MRPALSALERDLILAALAQDGREIDAFGRWMRQAGFDGAIDEGHYRLLPLIYGNLTRAGCSGPHMTRLRGVYRHSWCKSQELILRGAEAVSALVAAGVPVIVSKGLALALHYYDSPAHRPMSDIDLYVPLERVREAAAALRGLGYAGQYDHATFSDAHFADFTVSRHAEGFKRGGGEVDLHWYLMKQCRNAAANRRFWTNAQPLALTSDVSALQLRPDDMLLHAVVHGLQWNVMSPLRWVADAVLIVRRAGGELDWEALHAAAAKLRIASHFRSGLEYMRGLGVVALPDWPHRPVATLAERAERWAHGKSETVNLAADVVRMLNSDARTRLHRLAGKWVARRIGVL